MPIQPDIRKNNEVHITRQSAKPTNKLYRLFDKVTVIVIIIEAHKTIHKDLTKRRYDLGIKGPVETIQHNKDRQKSPGDLRRLAVTQAPVKNHQLSLA